MICSTGVGSYWWNASHPASCARSAKQPPTSGACIELASVGWGALFTREERCSLYRGLYCALDKQQSFKNMSNFCQ